MKKIDIEKVWHYITAKPCMKKINLIYDHILKDDDFPTAEETKKSYPNPCGYGTGMEDSIISAGTMVDACLIRYENKKDAETKTSSPLN